MDDSANRNSVSILQMGNENFLGKKNDVSDYLQFSNANQNSFFVVQRVSNNEIDEVEIVDSNKNTVYVMQIGNEHNLEYSLQVIQIEIQ